MHDVCDKISWLDLHLPQRRPHVCSTYLNKGHRVPLASVVMTYTDSNLLIYIYSQSRMYGLGSGFRGSGVRGRISSL